MKYSKEIKLFGVVINKENMKKLFIILDKYYPTYEIKIKNKNKKGIDITCASKEEFLDYDFTSFKATDFSIEANDNKFNHFSLTSPWSDYYIRFDYNDKEVITLIEGLINDWYSKVSPHKQVTKFLNSYWLPAILLIIAVSVITVFIIKNPNYINMIAWLSLIPIVIFVTVLSFALRSLFPKIEIDVGINNHKKFRHLVWGLLTLVIIPIILALVL